MLLNKKIASKIQLQATKIGALASKLRLQKDFVKNDTL